VPESMDVLICVGRRVPGVLDGKLSEVEWGDAEANCAQYDVFESSLDVSINHRGWVFILVERERREVHAGDELEAPK
jgi:hypothetical protein